MKETNNVWDTQHLSQDINSELGKWFSTRLDAREIVRKHYKETNMKEDTVQVARGYTEWIMKTGGFARDMTLRDHFAGLAMQALVSMPDVEMSHDACASWAYRQADAMLKERDK